VVSLARQGVVVAATDYEGLGTPGIHPYLVGSSEGRSILDAIRGAQNLSEAGAGAGAHAVVFGISQGGHATLWAAELAQSYAPDVQLVGAVAASPPMDLQAVQHAVLVGPQPSEVSWLEALLVTRAWRDVYGVSTTGLLTAEGQAIADVLDEICPWELDSPTENPFLDLDIPAWQELLLANSPGHAASTAPIHVVAALSDEQVPASTIDLGVDRLRAAGSRVDVRWVAGTHVSTLLDPDSAKASMAWIRDRFMGVPLA
ncbi:MAG: lipase family protein, partial [Chloroflexota bacterium]